MIWEDGLRAKGAKEYDSSFTLNETSSLNEIEGYSRNIISALGLSKGNKCLDCFIPMK